MILNKAYIYIYEHDSVQLKFQTEFLPSLFCTIFLLLYTTIIARIRPVYKEGRVRGSNPPKFLSANIKIHIMF